jgi:hypothetical protein
MPPPHPAAARAAQRLQNVGGYNHLIGMRFDIGKSTVEVKEKA